MESSHQPSFFGSPRPSNNRRAGALCLALAALTACRSHAAQSCVAIVTTNDMHGAIEPHLLEGAEPLRYGGLLVLASYIARLREHYGERMLLVDAGDIYQGTLVSNLSEGRAMIDAMSWLGYDAATVGNHEFDFGAGLAHHEGDGHNLSAEQRLSVLKARIADARFPFLIANINERATGRPITWPNTLPYTMVEKAGMRIGLIGIASPETPRLTRLQNVAAIDFLPPAPLIISAARTLRGQGAQLVVVIAHMGGGCARTEDPNDLSSCEIDDELFRLLAGLPPGTIDVAVGGHSHQLIAHWVNGVATVQASARARALGWIDACAKPAGGIDRARSVIHAPTSVCLDAWTDGTCKPRPRGGATVTATFMGHVVGPSAPLGKILEKYRAQVQAQAAQPIGVTLTEPLVRETKSGETPLGNAVCEGLRQATGASFALQNKGGLRADLPAGVVTYGQLFEVIPFDNRVAVLDLTGAELAAVIKHVLERKGGAGPLILGLRTEKTADGWLVRQADGTALLPAHHYKLATNDYLATGGEGLNHLLKDVAPERVSILDLELRDALMNYLNSVGGARPLATEQPKPAGKKTAKPK